MSTTAVQQTQPNEALVRQFDPVREYFSKVGGEEQFMREASFAAQILAGSDYLRKTTVESQILALTGLAQSGLTLSPIHKLAYLVPRNGKCVLEPSYMGMVKLLTDAGSVRHIESNLVFEGDDCEIDLASERKVLRHVPYWQRSMKKGVVRGVYSLATLADGSKHCDTMAKEEVDRIMERSESYKAYKAGKVKSSTWSTDYDEMARKTVVKRHWKSLPKTERMEHIAKAIDLDNAEYMEPARHQLAAAVDPAKAAQDALMDQVRAALNTYTGQDKKTIKQECVAFAGTGKVDPAFWETMLKRLQS